MRSSCYFVNWTDCNFMSFMWPIKEYQNIFRHKAPLSENRLLFGESLKSQLKIKFARNPRPKDHNYPSTFICMWSEPCRVSKPGVFALLTSKKCSQNWTLLKVIKLIYFEPCKYLLTGGQQKWILFFLIIRAWAVLTPWKCKFQVRVHRKYKIQIYRFSNYNPAKSGIPL